ncbi:hypothetical protein K6U37_11460, partial [Vibrio parahaemolyticus]|uniref:hypothetical protein n=1 Tax=Vibrio parahaemolyticus TaxID=670 RepID=UPI001EEC6CA1
MRLENELRIEHRISEYSEGSPLYRDYNGLKIVYDELTNMDPIEDSRVIAGIELYYSIINGIDFKSNIKNKVLMHEDCIELMRKIDLAIENLDYKNIKSKPKPEPTEEIFEIPFNEEKLKSIYNEIVGVAAILSNPNTTREQALKALEAYNDLMNDKTNLKLLNSTGNDISEKARVISRNIQEYFIIRDMVTFGYFVERMDNVSVYAYDISVKYQREGMNKYVDFYKSVTTKLNTFGDYIGESINDGKQNKVYKRKFYTELYN